jgi:hypothetical protein
LAGEAQTCTAPGVLQQVETGARQFEDRETVIGLAQQSGRGDLLDITPDFGHAGVAQQPERTERLVAA